MKKIFATSIVIMFTIFFNLDASDFNTSNFYDFDGNQFFDTGKLIELSTGNKILIYTYKKTKVFNRINIALLDKDNNLIKKNDTNDLNMTIRDFYISNDTLIKIIGFNSFEDSTTMIYYGLVYAEIDLNLGIKKIVYGENFKDKSKYNYIYPIFSNNGERILVGNFNDEKKLPEIKMYDLNCNLVKTKEIVSIPNNTQYPVTQVSLYRNETNIDFVMNLSSSTNNGLYIYNIDFNNLAKNSREFPPKGNQNILYCNSNKLGNYLVKYVYNALNIPPKNSFKVYDKESKLLFETDTLNKDENDNNRANFNDAYLCNKNLIFCISSGLGYKVPVKYHLNQFSSGGQFEQKYDFYDGTKDTSGMANFTYSENKNDKLSIMCQYFYKGLLVDKDVYKYGYNKVYLSSFDISTGIEINLEKKVTNIYPNPIPAGNTLHINTENNISDINIIDLLGVEIAKYDDKNIIIPANTAPGIYFIKYNENCVLKSSKIIVE